MSTKRNRRFLEEGVRNVDRIERLLDDIIDNPKLKGMWPKARGQSAEKKDVLDVLRDNNVGRFKSASNET